MLYIFLNFIFRLIITVYASWAPDWIRMPMILSLCPLFESGKKPTRSNIEEESSGSIMARNKVLCTTTRLSGNVIHRMTRDTGWYIL